MTPSPSRTRYQGQFRPEFSRLYLDEDLPWIIPLPITLMIAIVGDRFAGKSTATSYLAERHGFRVWSIGALVTDIALARGVSLADRSARIRFANELRAEYDDGAYLVRELLRRIRHSLLSERLTRVPPIVVTGVKHVEEVTVLSQLRDFRLWRLEASDMMRRVRAIKLDVLHDGDAAAMLRDEIDPPERVGISGTWDPRFQASLDAIRTAFPATQRITNSYDNRETLYARITQQLREDKPGALRVDI